jgi:hypothetical protein
METDFREGDEVMDSEGRIFIINRIDLHDMITLTSLDGKLKMLTDLISLQRGYMKRRK